MTLVQLKNNKGVDRYTRVPSFLGDFFNDFMSDELLNKNIFKSIPAVNISETNDKFAVELAVPGLDKNDFKLQVENGVLSISAEKKTETKDENTKFTRKEFSYSSFSRSFTLPEHVQHDAITAEYTNGVLTLSIPKKEEAKQKAAREIKVS
jgi:HSP20 family protein